jgi:glyoxylase I family protein
VAKVKLSFVFSAIKCQIETRNSAICRYSINSQTFYTFGLYLIVKRMLKHIHHIAIICSDYQRSKKFYTKVLGLEIINEVYRKERQSYKLDLGLNGQYIIELFSFPNPPQRPSQPEACGLRHLAFAVENLDETIHKLTDLGVVAEPIRTDALTGKQFTFTSDPDQLPIEFYEI